MTKQNLTDILRVRLTPENAAKLDALAAKWGVDRSKALRRILEEVVGIPVIGKIPSSGTAMYDRIDKMFADKVKLVQADGDIEIVGDDKARE